MVGRRLLDNFREAEPQQGNGVLTSQGLLQQVGSLCKPHESESCKWCQTTTFWQGLPS